METGQERSDDKTTSGFGKRVDDFLLELNEAGEKLQREFEEKFKDLQQTAERLKREAGSKERWKEVESNLKKAGDELNRAFHAAFRKRIP